MTDMQDKHREENIETLGILRVPFERNPENAKQGRLSFLQEAENMNSNAVSKVVNRRHNGWMQDIQSLFKFSNKERSPMFTAIATFLVITTLILGGGGVTVAAAQSSLPEQPLYDVKLWSEDIRLSLTDDPLLKSQLSQDFLNERFEEIVLLSEEGEVPTELVLTEYENQFEETIRLALNLPEEEAIQSMLEIQTRLQTQLQTLTQLHAKDSSNLEPVMLQTRDMIQNRLQIIDASLPEPMRLQEQIQQNAHQSTPASDNTQIQVAPATGNGKASNTETTVSGGGNGIPADNGQGNNFTVESTPSPSNGNGQGAGAGTDYVPAPVPNNLGAGQIQSPQPTPSNQNNGTGGSGSGGKRK
jgi:hypothetical protein